MGEIEAFMGFDEGLVIEELRFVRTQCASPEKIDSALTAHRLDTRS